MVALIAGIPGADPPSARAIHPENGARAACQQSPDPPPGRSGAPLPYDLPSVEHGAIYGPSGP